MVRNLNDILILDYLYGIQQANLQKLTKHCKSLKRFTNFHKRLITLISLQTFCTIQILDTKMSGVLMFLVFKCLVLRSLLWYYNWRLSPLKSTPLTTVWSGFQMFVLFLTTLVTWLRQTYFHLNTVHIKVLIFKWIWILCVKYSGHYCAYFRNLSGLLLESM